jgi:glycosyltransferase involved in cell wall biosynthesis
MLEREGAGVVADPDERDICAKVVRLLADVSERERIEQRARTVAEDRLAWPILTRQLEAFYRGTPPTPAS